MPSFDEILIGSLDTGTSLISMNFVVNDSGDVSAASASETLDPLAIIETLASLPAEGGTPGTDSIAPTLWSPNSLKKYRFSKN